MLRVLFSLLLGLSSVSAHAAAPARAYDVVVVGATPAGITAAIAAGRAGRSVVILERTGHIGGLPANGLGATDIGTRGVTLGLFAEFVRRIRLHYVETYGADSPQVRDCSDGYHFESSVAERVLTAMLAEHPSIEVRLRRQFDALPENVTLSAGRLTEIRVLERTSGAQETVRGGVFIDATYEGDLAAAAGAPYRVGREDKREFDEPMAGQLYKTWAGGIGPGSSGLGDNAVQAYNYRLPLTRVPENRVPIERPSDYRRDDYVSLIDDVRNVRDAGKAPASAERARSIDWIVSNTVLPNGKVDANNHHAAFLSTDLPEENWPWPTATWDWRDRFAQRLRNYALGLLWFCQNDPELPAEFRAACAEWGLSRDEFADNGYFPRQVYVREGRRIEGDYFFTAHDALPKAPGQRPPLHADSVTASHYALDSHAVRKREPGRVHLDGFFSMNTAPYTVPYRVMLPKRVEGLLVPVAVSATHVGLSTIRMEPCWMALGEAAGTAAHLALAQSTTPRRIDTGRLQHELVRHGVVLVYFRDVTPGHPAYEAVQQLALRGLLPEWTARLDEPMDAATLRDWRKALRLPERAAPENLGTRGALLRELWQELSR